MRKIYPPFLALVALLILSSCSSDDSIEKEEINKSYEFFSIQWRLEEGDGQEIIENKIPEFNFRNDSDTIIPAVIEPLENILGQSKFTFNDSIFFEKMNYSVVQIPIPKEIQFLSENYSRIGGGIRANLQKEQYNFPLSMHIKDSTSLNSGTELTSNYTLYFRKNKASFLAVFKEVNTDEIIELVGDWEGLFFSNIEGKSIINKIEK